MSENKEVKVVKKRMPREPKENFRRIRDLREDKDLTQKQIAEKLNCSQRVYSDYETGHIDVPNEVLINLRNIHGTTVDYILELTDVKEPLPDSRALKEKMILKEQEEKQKSIVKSNTK